MGDIIRGVEEGVEQGESIGYTDDRGMHHKGEEARVESRIKTGQFERRDEKRGPGKWQREVKQTPEIDFSQEADQCVM